VRIDGVKTVPCERVALDEFFSESTWVDVKIITPVGRAHIREIVMSTFDIGDIDAKGKASDIKTKTEGMAERELKIRRLKLQYGFGGTNMKSDGIPVTWGEPLWDALDEANPMILEAVLAKIDTSSKFVAKEGDTDPT
jgi:hypothetical protein